MEEIKAILGFDPEKLSRDSGAFFDRILDMHKSTAALTSRAESPDGRVAVGYSSSEGVTDLHIDPRAMRMPSQDLAETLLNLIRTAQAEVEADGRRRLTDLLGSDNTLIGDRAAIGRQLENASSAMEENLRGATAMIEQLQAVLRR